MKRNISKICITTLTTTNKFTGVASYLKNLIDNLQKIDNENKYVIITTKDNAHFFSIKNKNFKEIRISLMQSGILYRIMIQIWNILFFPIYLKLKRVNVVHLPNTMFISCFFPKTIITIHDIVDQKVVKYGKLRTLFRKYLVKNALNLADRVITVSNNSKTDLLAIKNREIDVIYNGFEEIYLQKDLTLSNNILNKYELEHRNYFIFIGTLLKHKNVTKLIELFHGYLKNKCEESTSKKLVIVGHKENDYQNIVFIIKKLKLENKVLILDYIGDDEKNILLNNAFAFTFLSLYEGFGFPILEAQSLNVPVIILDTSCLKEIGGDYCLVIENNMKIIDMIKSFNDISKKLENETFRENLVNKAYLNLQRFNWQNCAIKTLKIYES